MQILFCAWPKGQLNEVKEIYILFILNENILINIVKGNKTMFNA